MTNATGDLAPGRGIQPGMISFRAQTVSVASDKSKTCGETYVERASSRLPQRLGHFVAVLLGEAVHYAAYILPVLASAKHKTEFSEQTSSTTTHTTAIADTDVTATGLT